MGATTGVKRLFSFFREVRGEIDKVTWPGRQEVVITTLIVFLLALVASVFFSIVDTLVYKLVHGLIGK